MSHRNVALVLSYLLVGVASADAQLLQSERVAVIEITVTAETRPRPASPSHCQRHDRTDGREWALDAPGRFGPDRDHRRQGGLQPGDGDGHGHCRPVSGHPDPARAPDHHRGACHRVRHAHGQAHRGSADARRGARCGGNRGKAAHDAKRHRHDAERNGRASSPGHLAVARGGQRPRPGDARTLHAIPVGRPAVVRLRCRRSRSPADFRPRTWDRSR